MTKTITIDGTSIPPEVTRKLTAKGMDLLTDTILAFGGDRKSRVIEAECYSTRRYIPGMRAACARIPIL